jgi:hypothetical protein
LFAFQSNIRNHPSHTHARARSFSLYQDNRQNYARNTYMYTFVRACCVCVCITRIQRTHVLTYVYVHTIRAIISTYYY